MIDNKIETVVQRCYINARDLTRSAQLLVQHGGLLSAAYHLAVLAIEEVGKAAILKIDNLRPLAGLESGSLQRKLDDHYQKLFWAFFLGGFAVNKISRRDVEDARRLAQRMHEKRLASLYVAPAAADALLELPRSEVENTIKLVTP